MSEGPTRLTVRGGRDQFDWNNVKDDKHYQNYLGHSLKAPVGRWQHNKDLEWFNKAGESEESKRIARNEEMRVLKEAEEEAIAAAMGITLPPREQRAGIQDQVKDHEPSEDSRDHGTRRTHPRRSESPQATSKHLPPSGTHRREHRHPMRSGRDRRERHRHRSRSRERHPRRRRSRSRDARDHDTYHRSHHRRRSHSRERDTQGRRDKQSDR